MRARIKICGITNLDDALAACESGADALGFVFYDKSPRCINAQQAQKIIQKLPPFVTAIGLFVDANSAYIQQTLTVCNLSALQFHGNETPAQCRSYLLPYIKAIRVHPGLDLVECENTFADAQALLLDTYVVDVAGGTGKTFDWSLIPKQLKKPIVLSGGLNAENVGQAIRQIHPYAVDVSSGVEASPGKKSAIKMEAFFQSVKNAE